MKLHMIMGVTVHTDMMLRKLRQNKNSLVIVMDYELEEETEEVRMDSVLYCSPARARYFVAGAEQVVFHRFAYVAPRLIE